MWQMWCSRPRAGAAGAAVAAVVMFALGLALAPLLGAQPTVASTPSSESEAQCLRDVRLPASTDPTPVPLRLRSKDQVGTGPSCTFAGDTIEVWNALTGAQIANGLHVPNKPGPIEPRLVRWRE
jgi:hypothetical protein